MINLLKIEGTSTPQAHLSGILHMLLQSHLLGILHMINYKLVRLDL